MPVLLFVAGVVSSVLILPRRVSIYIIVIFLRRRVGLCV